MARSSSSASANRLTRADVTRQAELVVMEYLKSSKCPQTLDAMMQRLKAKMSSVVASELYAADLDSKKKAPSESKSVLEYMVQSAIANGATVSSAQASEPGGVKPRRRRLSSSAGSDSESGDAVWSKDDVNRLKKAIKQTSAVDDKNERWREIAALVGHGKSKKQCYVKYKELKDEKKGGETREPSPSASSRSGGSRRSSEDRSGKSRASSGQREVDQVAAAEAMTAAVGAIETQSSAFARPAHAPSIDPSRSVASATAHSALASAELQMEDVDDFDSVHFAAPAQSGKTSTSGGASVGGNTSTRAAPSSRSSRAPSADEVSALQRLLFSDEKKGFSGHWDQQGFFFTDVANLRYGLVQHEGGPCGVLAVVQAYVLRFLLANAPRDWQNVRACTSGLARHAACTGSFDELTVCVNNRCGNVWQPTGAQQASALVAALAHILHQASGSSRYVVVLNNERAESASGGAGRRKFMGGTVLFTLSSESETRALLTEHLGQFTAPRGNGLVLFVLSVALSKGVAEIKREMDHVEGVSDANSGGRFIGAHDYCTQEMVNLLLCGQACSNVFNGSQLLEGSSMDDPSAVVLKGVAAQATVGFLSLFEAYEYLVVGSHLKRPKFNIWVVCSESHYSVLFADPALLQDATLDTRATLDLFYYDGLANQDEVICLSVDASRAALGEDDGSDTDKTRRQAKRGGGGAAGGRARQDDLVPPLNLVIRTKWPRAAVDWHDVEPLL